MYWTRTLRSLRLQTAARARGLSLHSLTFSFLLSLALLKGSFPDAFSGLAKIENAVRAPLAEHVTGKMWGRVGIRSRHSRRFQSTHAVRSTSDSGRKGKPTGPPFSARRCREQMQQDYIRRGRLTQSPRRRGRVVAAALRCRALWRS